MKLDWIVFPPGSFAFLTLLAFLISLFVQLVNKKTVDYQKLRRLNLIQKEYYELQREFLRTGDKKIKKKMEKLKPDVDRARAESFSMTMKPMLYTTLPLLLIWQLLNPLYRDIPIVRLPLEFPFLSLFRRDSPLPTNVLGYISYYMLVSYLFSFILQKVLGTTLEVER
ncbi:MAG: hypothetical protein DRO00_05675 [Thermoproteota archaeon]|nr:MAG: hypothetical protein DRN92_02240 [Candidatus Korarchaeota archaeon]RLG48459.1 MAG: hypothetical protein DRN90_03500 [Candidatus Korarchaeota archaeon]RLG52369.1 MAG: hypothetical protein DRO00_05675 [Candidatus Korarchaeota archaeon]